MNERGRINNRARATQIKDFTGLRWGKITPTDIDGFIDFHNKLFIYIELKYGNATLPNGQRLALERQADAGNKAMIPTYVIVAQHLDEGDIKVAEAIVIEIYNTNMNKTKWHVMKNKTKTVKEIIDKIREHHNITGIK